MWNETDLHQAVTDVTRFRILGNAPRLPSRITHLYGYPVPVEGS